MVLKYWELPQFVPDPFHRCNAYESQRQANRNLSHLFPDTWISVSLWLQPMSSPLLKITAVTSLFWPTTAPTQLGIRGSPQWRQEEASDWMQTAAAVCKNMSSLLDSVVSGLHPHLSAFSVCQLCVKPLSLLFVHSSADGPAAVRSLPLVDLLNFHPPPPPPPPTFTFN